MENSIYKLIEIQYRNYKPQYPDFKISYETVGYFSSIANAEQAMKNKIGRYRNPPFGFWIKEQVLDLLEGEAMKSKRSYLSDGSLWDVWNALELRDVDSWVRFNGRSEDEMRFNSGDIVEIVLEYEEVVVLGIALLTPPTIEEAKEDGFPLDYYYVSPYYVGYNDNGSYIHYHEAPIDLFPPRFPVSDELQKKLKDAYKNIPKEKYSEFIED